MCELGYGYSIIGWQLELVRRSGIDEVVITTGPFDKLLENHVLTYSRGLHITFVNNPLYNETNYIYSMYLAREHLHDDILLLHGDLVLEPSVFNDLIASKYSVVTVDQTLPLPEKDFKAKIEEGRVKAIGIEYFGNNCYACQPAYMWKNNDFSLWMEEIERFCLNGQTKVYAENAFNQISDKLNLYPLELKRRLCREVDNPEDLKIVSGRFKELLEKTGG